MLFFYKSIVSIFFLLVAFVSAISMLTLMGRTETERKINPVVLRKIHKWSGMIFIILFLGISFFCIKYVAFIGDKLSVRAVFHGVLALILFAVLLLKLSIVKLYRQFLKFAPPMGMTLFSLALVTTLLSAGFFFLTRWHPPSVTVPTASVNAPGDAQIGKGIFENKCSFCHYNDRTEVKIGPGLKGILTRGKLPVSGKPATPENVIHQLKDPFKDMPSFRSSLSEQDINNLIAYLKTL
jgi:cytochrome c2